MNAIKIREKSCRSCKKRFIPARPLQVVCSGPCAYEYVKKNTDKVLEKQRKEALKEWNKEYKQRKEKDRTKSYWEDKLQDEVNHIVRLIDKGHECISSGAKNYIVNAGHLYSVGSDATLRFNLLNIYNQSVHDNHFKSSNGVIYKERIKEVFGQEVSEEIETLKARYKELKLSIPELKETIKVARSCVRELINSTKESDKPYTIEGRIEMRRFYNGVLGIYN